MKRIILLTSLLIIALACSAMRATASTNDLPLYSVRYDPQRNPFKDGRAAIKLAAETQRFVLIEVGGEWCTYCHVLDDFLEKNSDIKSRLHETFVILKINVSDENDNSEFLRDFPKPIGYPHMYITENNGDVLLSKDTAGFLVKGKYSRDRFNEFIDQWHVKKELAK